MTAVLITTHGCGGGIEHAKETGYTPEALAQELAFRVNGLKSTSNSRAATAGAASKVAAPEDSARGGEAGKTAPEEQTVEDVVRDILNKAAEVEGMTATEARGRIVELVKADGSLPADRKAAALGALEAAPVAP